MKYSKFNTFIPYEDKFLAYNSFTDKFLLLEPFLYELIKASIIEDCPTQIGNYHRDLYEELVKYGFILSEDVDEISEVKKSQKAKSVYKKRSGAIFTKDWIPNYQHRRKLSDTILFNKKYLRFEVNSPFSYTRYYVNKTDTILPYSLYKQADIDYKGRIERIDSYNKKQDIFVTLQLIPKKNWDKEAQDFFEFNQFANKKNKN